MRTALLTDIHANLHALTAVLDDVRESGAEAIACLGDTVGYGADPRRCVELIRSLGCPCVMGNHDYYTAMDSPEFAEILGLNDGKSNPVWSGIRHAREQLQADQFEWLRALELVKPIDGALIAHAALHDLEGWPYLQRDDDARQTLAILKGRVGFFGHTHRENIFLPDGSAPVEELDERLVRLPEGSVAITVGSVGQPRDGDPRARWVFWDPVERTVEFRRVEYDVRAAAQAILDAGLPPLNAIRLFQE